MHLSPNYGGANGGRKVLPKKSEQNDKLKAFDFLKKSPVREIIQFGKSDLLKDLLEKVHFVSSSRTSRIVLVGLNINMRRFLICKLIWESN